MKTEVIITADDQRYNDFKKGDRGYVDGYVRGGNNEPLAVVVRTNGSFVLVPLNLIVKKP